MANESDKKPAVASFFDNLNDLVTAGKELLASAPAALGEASAMLPKELQSKKPFALPIEIVVPFEKGDEGWEPIGNGIGLDADDAGLGRKMGKYRLVEEWDQDLDPSSEAEKPPE